MILASGDIDSVRKVRSPPNAEVQCDTFSEAWCGSSAPLPLGESGASSVTGGSERRGALLGCP